MLLFMPLDSNQLQLVKIYLYSMIHLTRFIKIFKLYIKHNMEIYSNW